LNQPRQLKKKQIPACINIKFVDHVANKHALEGKIFPENKATENGIEINKTQIFNLANCLINITAVRLKV
jgi:hypothetical protein